MGWFLKLLKSSLGRKYIMSLTGCLMLFGFLAPHLAGNLLIFVGQDAMNSYAASLKSLGALLWALRLIMLGAFLLHVRTGIVLTKENRQARPVRYQCDNTIQASWASRYMWLTGLVVLFYLVYHLAHFTFHATGVQIMTDSLGRPDVYGMVVSSFQVPVISITYVAAMVVTGIHLHHGGSSLFQSLGAKHKKYEFVLTKCVRGFCWALCIGFSSIPLSILAGIVK